MPARTGRRALLRRNRKANREPRAAARLAPHVDLPAVLLEDALRERQPVAGAALARREEELEAALAHVGRHADACVGDLERDEAALAARAHEQLAAAFHRLPRVREEVQDRLLEVIAVDRQARKLAREIGVHADARLAA